MTPSVFFFQVYRKAAAAEEMQDNLLVMSGEELADSTERRRLVIQVDLTQRGAFAAKKLEGRRASLCKFTLIWMG